MPPPTATPLPTDCAAPRLSWQLSDARTGARQTAYCLLVADSPEALADDRGSVWDSGRQESGQSVFVPWAGPARQPRTRYWWKVRLWDHTGAETPWREPAWFETGTMAEDWPGAWIGSSAAGSRDAGGPWARTPSGRWRDVRAPRTIFAMRS